MERECFAENRSGDGRYRPRPVQTRARSNVSNGYSLGAGYHNTVRCYWTRFPVRRPRKLCPSRCPDIVVISAILGVGEGFAGVRSFARCQREVGLKVPSRFPSGLLVANAGQRN